MNRRPSPKDRTLPPVGWREWVFLPALSERPVKAKVDTGARSSAIHAFEQSVFEHDGVPWVRFRLHADQPTWCEATLLERRRVRNSGGQEEERCVIRTLAMLGQARWAIELTLTDRAAMGFPMLLGRLAVRNRFLVDPGRSFVQSRKVQTQRRPGSSAAADRTKRPTNDPTNIPH